jgi:hypothetical protein
MASGFNVVDFMALPPAERCLVRLLLRQSALSYPQLRAEVSTMPAGQRLNQSQLDAALEHLTHMDWLVSLSSEGETYYDINVLQKNNPANRTYWDDLDLDTLDADGSFRVDLRGAEAEQPARLGGKRKLPSHIWDCLSDPAESKAMETPARRPARRAGLLDGLMDHDSRDS